MIRSADLKLNFESGSNAITWHAHMVHYMNIVQFIVYSVQFIAYSLQCTLERVFCVSNCTMYRNKNVHSKKLNNQCTLYAVCEILYSVYCTSIWMNAKGPVSVTSSDPSCIDDTSDSQRYTRNLYLIKRYCDFSRFNNVSFSFPVVEIRKSLLFKSHV